MYEFFRDKVVIVTGASKGIGKCLASALLSCGAKVAGLARSKNLLNEIASGSEGTRFLGVECDISDPDLVASAMQTISDCFGEIDILINNAGIGLMGPALQTGQTELNKCFDINFFGAINCIDQVAPKMVARKKGVIVNVTSIVARYGLPTVSVYSASKAALSAYSQGLRNELAPAGVDVITVYPGNTDTAFHEDLLRAENYAPPKRKQRDLLSPEYVAGEILRCIVDKKAEAIIGRPAKLLNLLKSATPSLLGKVLSKEFGIADWYKKTGPGKKNFFSEIDASIDSGVAITGLDKPCQYHTTTGKEKRALPGGLSPSLYYILYPYLLAISYGGKLFASQEYRNPVSGDGPETESVLIRRKPPHLIERAKNIVKTILSPFLPLGRIKTAPEIETAHGVFPFDLGYDGSLCPAAFRSFFPFKVFNHFLNKNNPEDLAWEACCPDHLKNHSFSNVEASRQPEESFYESICFWGEHSRIESVSACSSCPSCETKENPPVTRLEDISKTLGVACPALLNVMYGYYLTLAKGGELAFYSKSFDAGIAQCPNPKSRVVLEVFRKEEAIEFNTIDVLGCECPRGIKKGDSFTLPRAVEQNKVCLDAFNSLFLSSGIAEFSSDPLAVQCVLKDCDASWKVSSLSREESGENLTGGQKDNASKTEMKKAVDG